MHATLSVRLGVKHNGESKKSFKYEYMAKDWAVLL